MCKVYKTVLVVDDQEQWREIIAELLNEAGYAVTCAKSFREALVELDRHSFHAAVVDIRLEEQTEYNVDGINLLEFVWRRKAGPPVILLTGHASRALMQKADWYQAFGFLEKIADDTAFDQRLLLQMVARATGD